MSETVANPYPRIVAGVRYARAILVASAGAAALYMVGPPSWIVVEIALSSMACVGALLGGALGIYYVYAWWVYANYRCRPANTRSFREWHKTHEWTSTARQEAGSEF